MSLNIKFSYLAENSKFSRSNSYFSILTPTFLRDGFLNSCFQNPSENSDKCEVVKSFLASEKVNVLNHPPYSPDLSPCDFMFISKT